MRPWQGPEAGSRPTPRVPQAASAEPEPALAALWPAGAVTSLCCVLICGTGMGRLSTSPRYCEG